MKKKISALVLALGFLLLAQPALAQGEPLPETTVQSDERVRPAEGARSRLPLSFRLIRWLSRKA